MSESLTNFLLARIAEDEAAARAATPGPWRTDGTTIGGARHQPVVMGGFDSAGSLQDPCAPWDATHIARHDPARVLAECAAKRRLVRSVERSMNFHPAATPTCPSNPRCACDPCLTLRTLALPYADHPDYATYDAAWRSGADEIADLT